MKAKFCGLLCVLASVALLSLPPTEADAGLLARLFGGGGNGYSSCGSMSQSNGYSSCGNMMQYNGYSNGYSSCSGPQQSIDYSYSYAPPVYMQMPVQSGTYCVNGVCYTTAAPQYVPPVVAVQKEQKPKLQNGLVFNTTTNCPHCEASKDVIAESGVDVIISEDDKYLVDWPAKYELGYPAWIRYKDGKVAGAWAGKAEVEDIYNMAGVPLPRAEMETVSYDTPAIDYTLFQSPAYTLYAMAE